MNRKALLCGVMGACLVQAAAADDLTVSNDSKTAVKTSSAANSTPGQVNVTGTISVTTGTAVTLDSSNNVILSGGIVNSSPSNGIGINVLGGNTASVLSSGSIQLTGTTSNNIGLLLNGAGAFTGDISFLTGSSIQVQGANGIGIGLYSPITGNVTQTATMLVVGENSSGIISASSVSGMFSNYGTTQVQGVLTADVTKLDPQAGYGIAIGGNIGAGFINGGPFAATDTINPTAVISTLGAKPALYISPSIAGASAADLTIGTLVDATNPGYSLINRGTITGGGNDPGVHAKAMRIEGDATHTAALPGGIYNRGTIRSASTSDNITASTSTAVAADSTALAIGLRGSVSRIDNDGTIQATTSGPKGGTAVAVSVESGGSLSAINNTGTISALAFSTDTALTGGLGAYAVRDRSGTLRTINNTGAIVASATTLTNGSQAAVAIDLSTTAAGVTVVNSGTISGDMIFGTGANSLVLNGASALVDGGVRAKGAGTLAIAVQQGALQSVSTRATTLNVASGGALNFVLGRTLPAGALVVTTGNATLDAGALVRVTPSTFLASTGTYTLINAGGGLTFGDFTTATSASSLPFLFSGTFSRDANNLYLSLQRKTAAQAGLTGNAALFYEPLTGAALTDDQFGAALLAITNAADATSAINSLLPDTTGATRVLTEAVASQATGPVATRSREMATSLADRSGFGFWGQEFYNISDQKTNASGNGSFASGMGTAVGIEWGATDTGRYGAGYTFYAGQATEHNPRQSKMDVSFHLFSLYSGWRMSDFFIAPQASLGIGQFSSKRVATVGALSRTMTGSWTGYLGSAGVASGYVIDMGFFQLVPQISLDGSYLRQSGYTEGGGLGANLKYGTQDVKSVRAFVGVSAGANYAMDDGNLRPQVLAGWTKEFLNDRPVIDASFEALPGSPMALVGRPVEDSQLIGGAGFNYVMRNWSAGVNYDAASREGALSQTATVSLTSRF